MTTPLTRALSHMAITIQQDVIDVFGRAVTVSTIWLPGPWWHHETAIYWGDDEFHVVATDPGSISAVRSHIHWTCFPHLAKFVLAQEDSNV